MTEHQKYDVETVYEGWEVRHYPPHLVAEVDVRGPFDEAVNRGFRSLAAFIFGENVGNHKVAMTTPVMQEPVSEKISMTTPVVQESDGDQHVVAFVMPGEFTMETLPRPKDGSIRIREIAGSLAAVRQFSGRASGEKFAEQLSGLLSRLQEHPELAIVGSPRFARFDPPWKPGFLRRNEVLVTVQRIAT
ncbi:MAG: SOUL family heme-binding protein [Arachnia sp.]